MSRWNTVLTLTAAAAMSAAACTPASGTGTTASTAAASLTALDYIEIEQLALRYGWALDSGADNGFAYADLYTDDGVFIGTNQGPDGRSYQGRDTLASLARGGRRGPLYVSHLVTNVVITPTPEGAIGRSFVAILDLGERGVPPTAGHGGFYDDVYVRTERGWRIKQRSYYESKWGEPSVQPVPPPLPPIRALSAADGPSRSASTQTLAAEDYIAIQQLVSQYPYALDMNSDNGATYASLFAPGAVFSRPRTTGAEALAALATSQPHGPNYVRHFITNHVIDPVPGGATGRQYAAIIDIGERGQPHSIFLVGLYEDEYVKTADGWRFQTRTFTPAARGDQPGQTGAAAR
jgi:hypothetical protein